MRPVGNVGVSEMGPCRVWGRGGPDSDVFEKGVLAAVLRIGFRDLKTGSGKSTERLLQRWRQDLKEEVVG